MSVSVLPNYVQLVESIPSLSIWTGYLKQSPILLSGYADLHNVTCFAPNDASFQPYFQNPAYNNENNSTADPSDNYRVILYSCVYGIHHASSFSTQGTFFHSLLNGSNINALVSPDSPFFNSQPIQRGGAVLEGIKEGNDSAILTGVNADYFFPNVSDIHPGVRQKGVIVQPDIKFSGGLLHMIDDLFSPTIYNVAQNGAILNNSEISAANASGALDRAKKDHAVTVFAASNKAWLSYTRSDVSAAKIAQTEKYGVVPGKIIYPDRFTPTGSVFETEEGEPILLHRVDKSLYVNNIKVETSSILLSNGILYILDG